MIPTTVRIFVCTEAQDMRRSFDALAQQVKERLCEDPQDGSLFVFANKRSTRLKVLWFDRNGYCILYKRLHEARFVLPSAASNERPMARIDGRMLAMILSGVKKERASREIS
jgi:transposase